MLIFPLVKRELGEGVISDTPRATLLSMVTGLLYMSVMTVWAFVPLIAVSTSDITATCAIG